MQNEHVSPIKERKRVQGFERRKLNRDYLKVSRGDIPEIRYVSGKSGCAEETEREGEREAEGKEGVDTAAESVGERVGRCGMSEGM